MNPTNSPHDPEVSHQFHSYDDSYNFLAPEATTGIKLMSDALSFAKEKGLGVFYNSQSLIADNGKAQWRAAIGLTFPYVCPKLGAQPAAEYHYSDHYHPSLELAESFLLDRLFLSTTFVRVLHGIGQGVLCEFLVAATTKDSEEDGTSRWAFLRRQATGWSNLGFNSALALFVLLKSQNLTEGWRDRATEEGRKFKAHLYEFGHWYCNTATEDEKTTCWTDISLGINEMTKSMTGFITSHYSPEYMERAMRVVINNGDAVEPLLAMMRNIHSFIENARLCQAALH